MIRDEVRLANIKRMKANGMSNKQIADYYELSRQRIGQLLTEIDDDAKLAEMATLREAGWTLLRIGKHFDMDARRVSEWLSKYEFPPRRCIYCGKRFVPVSKIRDYCDVTHERAMQAAHKRYYRRGREAIGDR